MEELYLDVQLREELGKAKVKDLREQGFIPAVVYGQGNASQAIKVPHKQLLQLFHQHRLENAIINLKIKDEKKAKPKSCLIKEIQYDPVNGGIKHIDFNEISLSEVIKVSVPVVAKGEPQGVKQEGGSLEHILWEIEVECLPTEIPKQIEVDVTSLKIGDSIHINEISFPANIKVLNDPSSVVLSVASPIKEEVVAPPVEGEEKAEPEVIKEKKEIPAEGQTQAASGKEKEKEKK